MNVLLELSQTDDTLGRLNRDAHLVPVVSAREMEAMGGRPNGTAQDHPARRDLGCGDLHATSINGTTWRRSPNLLPE